VDGFRFVPQVGEGGTEVGEGRAAFAGRVGVAAGFLEDTLEGFGDVQVADEARCPVGGDGGVAGVRTGCGGAEDAAGDGEEPFGVHVTACVLG
jgi:hypothetical protein